MNDTSIFNLPNHGLIELAGADARGFLHNLCTQDVKNLPVGAMAEAFLTNAKARVIAHIWITPRSDESIWIDMVPGQADKVMQHLNHYLISERVELSDQSKENALIRVVGLNADSGMTPTRRHNLLGVGGVDFLVATNEADALKQRILDRGAVAGTAEDYEILRIEAGVPQYGVDIDENRLAMEVNRAAQAISYTKGCYLGQETIVMARDRGQVNRLLMGLKIADGPPPEPGTPVSRGSDEVGTVTSSIRSPRFGVIALAYLRRGSWDVGTEVSVAGRSAIACALPFSSTA